MIAVNFANSKPLALAASLLMITACSSGGGDDGDASSGQPTDGLPGQPAPNDDSTLGGGPLPEGMVPQANAQRPVNPDNTMLDNIGMQPLGADNGQEQQMADQGDLVPVIFESETGLDEMFAQSGAALALFFNDSLILPRDVPVNFIDCGQANAFYAPDATEVGFPGPNIFMCNELTAEFLNFYGDAESAFEASAFVFMHELGHALVDQLNLPVLGIEESYVDGVAAVFAGEGGLARATLQAGLFFMQQTETSWFDTHRAGPQRFGDLACWAIGADPSLTNDPDVATIANQLVDAGRNCDRFYQQQLDGLTQLLNPHIKGGLGDSLANLADAGTVSTMIDNTSVNTGMFFDASTSAGNTFFVYVDDNAVFAVDFQGDSVDQGESCYIVFQLPFPREDFTVNEQGALTLDGQLVGPPILLEDIPNFPECEMPSNAG